MHRFPAALVVVLMSSVVSPGTQASPAPASRPAPAHGRGEAEPPTDWGRTGALPAFYELTRDASNPHGGVSSTRFRLRDDAPFGGSGAFEQHSRVGAFGGKRVRMSAWIRTEDVSEAGGMWFRADMPNGAAAVIDNTTFRAPIRGTTDWARVEIVLDIPATAVMLAYGGILQGAGSLWIDDVQFEIVDPSVPVTAFDPRWSDRGSKLSLLDAPGKWTRPLFWDRMSFLEGGGRSGE